MTKKDLFNEMLKMVDGSLKNDLTDLKENKFFDFKKTNLKKESKLNQKYASLNFRYGEMIYIVPINPMFSAGTIIGCVNKELPRTNDGWGNPKAIDREDSESFDFIDPIGERKKSLYAFPSIKKLMNVTAMVTEELIEIKKCYCFSKGFNTNHENEKTVVTYEVTHYVHLINGNEKIVIPTMLFDPNFNTRSANGKSDSNTMFFEEDTFDINLIQKIYRDADPNSIISPMSILSKP